MKGFGLWVLFFVFGTALLFVCLSSIPGSDLAPNRKIMKLTHPSRKLEEYVSNEGDSGNLGVYDYVPNDPVPSSKATIRPGPIEHGTPLMPYIPKPAPPSPGPNEPENVGLP